MARGTTAEGKGKKRQGKWETRREADASSTEAVWKLLAVIHEALRKLMLARSLTHHYLRAHSPSLHRTILLNLANVASKWRS